MQAKEERKNKNLSAKAKTKQKKNAIERARKMLLWQETGVVVAVACIIKYLYSVEHVNVKRWKWIRSRVYARVFADRWTHSRIHMPNNVVCRCLRLMAVADDFFLFHRYSAFAHGTQVTLLDAQQMIKMCRYFYWCSSCVKFSGCTCQNSKK